MLTSLAMSPDLIVMVVVRKETSVLADAVIVTFPFPFPDVALSVHHDPADVTVQLLFDVIVMD
jgi:hypothetical protein